MSVSGAHYPGFTYGLRIQDHRLYKLVPTVKFNSNQIFWLFVSWCRMYVITRQFYQLNLTQSHDGNKQGGQVVRVFKVYSSYLRSQ